MNVALEFSDVGDHVGEGSAAITLMLRLELRAPDLIIMPWLWLVVRLAQRSPLHRITGYTHFGA